MTEFIKKDEGSSKDLPAYNVLPHGYCTGCGACVAICPKKALSFTEDMYGYYVPLVDEELCNKCGICQKLCPALSGEYKETKSETTEIGSTGAERLNPSLWTVKISDEKVLKESTSGGVFTLLASKILSQGGVVAGAAWTHDLKVKHVLIDKEEDIGILRKSKYMQSFIGNLLQDVKNHLTAGRKVLFSGCPCQVAGLKSFLRKDYDNLYTIDLLCGNAPSYKFFQMYLKESFKDLPVKYDFRNKDFGLWYSHAVKVTSKDNTETGIMKNDDLYQRAYHPHMMCPIHCEKCKYQSLPRKGDITIGDFWGLKKKEKEIFVDDGVSAVLLNNLKGESLFNSLDDNLFSLKKQVPLSWLGGNGYALEGTSNYAAPGRNRFYQAIASGMTFLDSLEYAGRVPTKDEINKFVRNDALVFSSVDDNVSFIYHSEDWEQHKIYGDTYLFPLRSKSPINKYAWLAFKRKIINGRTYRAIVSFKASTENDFIIFFIMNSVLKNRQPVFKFSISKHKFSISKHISEIYTTKEFTFTANDDYNSFMIAASQFTGMDPWFALKYIVVYEELSDIYEFSDKVK